MAKYLTPAMEKYSRKYSSEEKKYKSGSPGRAAWRRLLRNKTAIFGLVVISIIILVAIFADVIAPYPYQEQDYNAMNQAPSLEHPFGTDQMGRDIFSRCVYGARYSLPIGLLSVTAGLCLGGTLGVIAGYFGRKVDNAIMRVMDIFQAIPSILMAIAVVASIGNGIPQLVFAMSLGSMPIMAKTWRAAIFTVKESEYVESSKSIGASQFHIIVRHLLPNILGVVIIGLVGALGGAILQISALSYLGIGITPPTPEWGSILAAGKDYLRSGVHMVLFPGLMIGLTVSAFNLLGQGVRDAFDPKLK